MAIQVDFFLMSTSAIMAFTLIINAFVVSLYCHRRQLLRTPSNRLLISLACCDLLSGFSILSRILLHVLPDFRLPFCKPCVPIRILIEIFTTFLVECIVLHLCAITLDRFLSIFYSLRYKTIVTSRKLKYCIAACWITAFLASAIQICWLYPYMFHLNVTREDELRISKIEVWFSITSLILFFFLPLLLLGVAFFIMFLEIRKLIISKPVVSNKRKHTKTKRQRRILYTFGTMYILFCILTLPFFTVRLIHDINLLVKTSINVTMFFYRFIYTLKIIPSCVNPIIYVTFNRDFRHTIQKMYYQNRLNREFNTRKKSIFTHAFRKISSAISSTFAETSVSETSM